MDELIRRLEQRASIIVERRTGEELTVTFLGTMRMHETGERRVVFQVGEQTVDVPLRLLRRIVCAEG
jgi:hypothetical protein